MPGFGRTMPYFSSLPSARSRIFGNIQSFSACGIGRLAMPTIWIGTPKSWRGTMCTPLRTEIVGCAPLSARSSAISAPVLPIPMTSTFLPT